MAVSAALIVALSPESQAVVGGVSLLVRAARTLRAAGFTEIRVVAGSHAPEVTRLLTCRSVEAELWNGGASGLDEARSGAEPVLVISGDILFESDVLAPLLAAAEPGQLRVGSHPAIESGRVPAAICPRGDLARLVAGLRDGSGTLGQALGGLGHAASAAVPLGQGLCLASDPAHRATLTDALLEHVAGKTAATDGYLTTLLDRHLSRAITRRLLAWPMTPNQITVASILVGLAGALGLATVSYATRLAGVLALFASSVLDGVDGELARARGEHSAFGARLDLAGDYAIHLATFAALGIGLAREGLSMTAVWAAGALLGGVTVAMTLVHALVIRPALPKPRDLHRDGETSGSRRMALARAVEKVAGRDYTYLMLVFALIGHLEWFVYAAAVGSWIFVVVLLGYWTQGGHPRAFEA